MFRPRLGHPQFTNSFKIACGPFFLGDEATAESRNIGNVPLVKEHSIPEGPLRPRHYAFGFRRVRKTAKSDY
jgi:hypothetical protein